VQNHSFLAVPIWVIRVAVGAGGAREWR
jgi:hypothetical protein